MSQVLSGDIGSHWLHVNTACPRVLRESLSPCQLYLASFALACKSTAVSCLINRNPMSLAFFYKFTFSHLLFAIFMCTSFCSFLPLSFLGHFYTYVKHGIAMFAIDMVPWWCRHFWTCAILMEYFTKKWKLCFIHQYQIDKLTKTD